MADFETTCFNCLYVLAYTCTLSNYKINCCNKEITQQGVRVLRHIRHAGKSVNAMIVVISMEKSLSKNNVGKRIANRRKRECHSQDKLRQPGWKFMK